jgi:hypothetical protein
MAKIATGSQDAVPRTLHFQRLKAAENGGASCPAGNAELIGVSLSPNNRGCSEGEARTFDCTFWLNNPAGRRCAVCVLACLTSRLLACRVRVLKAVEEGAWRNLVGSMESLVGVAVGVMSADPSSWLMAGPEGGLGFGWGN